MHKEFIRPFIRQHPEHIMFSERLVRLIWIIEERMHSTSHPENRKKDDRLSCRIMTTVDSLNGTRSHQNFSKNHRRPCQKTNERLFNVSLALSHWVWLLMKSGELFFDKSAYHKRLKYELIDQFVRQSERAPTLVLWIKLMCMKNFILQSMERERHCLYISLMRCGVW